jgi:hypothetical protein
MNSIQAHQLAKEHLLLLVKLQKKQYFSIDTGLKIEKHLYNTYNSQMIQF